MPVSYDMLTEKNAALRAREKELEQLVESLQEDKINASEAEHLIADLVQDAMMNASWNGVGRRRGEEELRDNTESAIRFTLEAYQVIPLRKEDE